MELADKLWPLNRSILGNGNRETLSFIQNYVGKDFDYLKFESGTKVYDWTIPDEWHVDNAYVIDPYGEKILDFKKNNLHLMGYSIAVNSVMNFEELNLHLYSLPDQPDAIPYVTSYYHKNWGFCLSHDQRKNLPEGDYRVVIESSFTSGHLEIAEYLIKGKSQKEIFLSTYICHPSMANNELSGPLVCANIAKTLVENFTNCELNYSVRIAFMPETIGSISYIKANLERMKKNVICGFVVTCVGDQRKWSFLPTRLENTVADRSAIRVLQNMSIMFDHYSWLDRGSDERQYCSPGVDLPIASVMRSKYGTFPEYHTSNDKFGSVVTEEGIRESVNFYLKLLEEIQQYSFPSSTYLCEPNLGSRNLYPLISIKVNYENANNLLNVLSHCDGKTEEIEIARLTKLNIAQVKYALDILKKNQLIYFERVENE
jgi:aminopeptidase-like protein